MFFLGGLFWTLPLGGWNDGNSVIHVIHPFVVWCLRKTYSKPRQFPDKTKILLIEKNLALVQGKPDDFFRYEAQPPVRYVRRIKDWILEQFPNTRICCLVIFLRIIPWYITIFHHHLGEKVFPTTLSKSKIKDWIIEQFPNMRFFFVPDYLGMFFFWLPLREWEKFHPHHNSLLGPQSFWSYWSLTD